MLESEVEQWNDLLSKNEKVLMIGRGAGSALGEAIIENKRQACPE